MPHVYASLAQLNDHLRDAGSATFASEATAIRTLKRAILESVSRTIDGYCQRSAYGSGFGPRTGTNRYSGDGGDRLNLRDDLLTVTSLTVRPHITGTATAYTEETDFVSGPYDATPRRWLYLHGYGALSAWIRADRNVTVVGTWGYSNTRSTAAATANAIGSSTTTSVTVSDGAEFSPAQTLLIDAEQMYVTAVSGTTLTVERGVNGTTAATHGAAAAIGIYSYPADVHEACLALALRRWKKRDAGSDGSDAGGEVPSVRMASERSMLETRLTALRMARVR